MAGYGKVDVNSENCHLEDVKDLGDVPPTQEDIEASNVYEKYYPLQDPTTVKDLGIMIFEVPKSADGVKTDLAQSFIKLNMTSVISIPSSLVLGYGGNIAATVAPTQNGFLMTGPKTMDNFTVCPVNGFKDLLFTRQSLEINSQTTNMETYNGDVIQQVTRFMTAKRADIDANALTNTYSFCSSGWNFVGGYCANPKGLSNFGGASFPASIQNKYGSYGYTNISDTASTGGSLVGSATYLEAGFQSVNITAVTPNDPGVANTGVYHFPGMVDKKQFNTDGFSQHGLDMYVATKAKRWRAVMFGGYMNFDFMDGCGLVNQNYQAPGGNTSWIDKQTAHPQGIMYTNTNFTLDWQPYCPLWHVAKSYPDRMSFRLTLTRNMTNLLFSKSTNWALINSIPGMVNGAASPTIDLVINSAVLYLKRDVLSVDAAAGLVSAFSQGINWKATYLDPKIVYQPVNIGTTDFQTYSLCPGFRPQYCVYLIRPNYQIPAGMIPFVESNCSMMMGSSPGNVFANNPQVIGLPVASQLWSGDTHKGAWALNTCSNMTDLGLNCKLGAFRANDSGLLTYQPSPVLTHDIDSGDGLDYAGNKIPVPTATSVYVQRIYLQRAGRQFPLRFNETKTITGVQSTAGINQNVIINDGGNVQTNAQQLVVDTVSQFKETAILNSVAGDINRSKVSPSFIRFPKFGPLVSQNTFSVVTDDDLVTAARQISSSAPASGANTSVPLFMPGGNPVESGYLFGVPQNLTGDAYAFQYAPSSTHGDVGRTLSQTDILEFHNMYKRCVQHDDPMLRTEDFVNYFLYCFDMSIGGDGIDIFDPTEDGSIDLVIQFSGTGTNIAYDTYLITYTPKVVTITPSRSVEID